MVGLYSCICKDGYIGDGFVCVSKSVIDKKGYSMDEWLVRVVDLKFW